MNEATRLRALVAWNPSAGRADEIAALRERLERAAGVQIARTESPDDLRARVREAAHARVETVVAAGGDGTVHLVANELAGAPDTALAVIPIGTGNDAARTLGVPLDAAEAVDLILEGRAKRVKIDLIEADTDDGTVLAINSITGGDAARVVDRTAPEAKSKWGPLAYFASAWSVLRRQKIYRGRLWIEAEPERRLKMINLHFGNGRTSSGGFPSAPEADPADGRVDLVALKPASIGKLLSSAFRRLFRLSKRDPRLLERQVRSARFELEPEPDWRIDGEPSAPVRAVRARSRALIVCTPDVSRLRPA